MAPSNQNLNGWQGNALPFRSVVIADGAQVSEAIDCGGMALCGVLVPASFTGTALTFEVSDAIDGTFVPLKSTAAGAAISYTVAPSQYNAIDPTPFQGVRFLRAKSGTVEVGAKTLKLSLKGL